jgi:serine/threonine protein kinase
VHINTIKYNQESVVYRHLADIATDMVGRPGKQHLRELYDSFTVTSQHGDHEVFVMTPLGMSLRTLQEMQPKHVFEKQFVISAVDQVLLGLYYLHASEVVHTGESDRNHNVIDSCKLQ